MYRPGSQDSKLASATYIANPQVSINPTQDSDLRKKIEEITRRVLSQIK
jgi:hypothetical protein